MLEETKMSNKITSVLLFIDKHFSKLFKRDAIHHFVVYSMMHTEFVDNFHHPSRQSELTVQGRKYLQKTWENLFLEKKTPSAYENFWKRVCVNNYIILLA